MVTAASGKKLLRIVDPLHGTIGLEINGVRLL